ncbi:misfolded glycoproteins degradation protein Yos9 [Pseudohyphozyma bogoriensis]|nr:misfolded glycoproteins degradation protein Yos9 [Pseudohyphozyma bogoriensis]
MSTRAGDLPLARVGRLLRQLRATLAALVRELQASEERSANEALHRREPPKPKGKGKGRAWDDDEEYAIAPATKRLKRKSAAHQTSSSPFQTKRRPQPSTTYGSKRSAAASTSASTSTSSSALNRRSPPPDVRSHLASTGLDYETITKALHLLRAYINVLECVYGTEKRTDEVPKIASLVEILARKIGGGIEEYVEGCLAEDALRAQELEESGVVAEVGSPRRRLAASRSAASQEEQATQLEEDWYESASRFYAPLLDAGLANPAKARSSALHLGLRTASLSSSTPFYESLRLTLLSSSFADRFFYSDFLTLSKTRCYVEDEPHLAQLLTVLVQVGEEMLVSIEGAKDDGEDDAEALEEEVVMRLSREIQHALPVLLEAKGRGVEELGEAVFDLVEAFPEAATPLLAPISAVLELEALARGIDVTEALDAAQHDAGTSATHLSRLSRLEHHFREFGYPDEPPSSASSDDTSSLFSLLSPMITHRSSQDFASITIFLHSASLFKLEASLLSSILTRYNSLLDVRTTKLQVVLQRDVFQDRLKEAEGACINEESGTNVGGAGWRWEEMVDAFVATPNRPRRSAKGSEKKSAFSSPARISDSPLAHSSLGRPFRLGKGTLGEAAPTPSNLLLKKPKALLSETRSARLAVEAYEVEDDESYSDEGEGEGEATETETEETAESAHVSDAEDEETWAHSSPGPRRLPRSRLTLPEGTVELLDLSMEVTDSEEDLEEEDDQEDDDPFQMEILAKAPTPQPESEMDDLDILEADRRDLRYGTMVPSALVGALLLTLASSTAALSSHSPKDLFSYPRFEVVIGEQGVLNDTAAQIIHDSKQPSDTGEPKAAVHLLRTQTGQAFLCTVPAVNDLPSTPPAPDDLEAKGNAERRRERGLERGLALIDGMKGSCLYQKHGWFTYSFCYGNEIRQFHEIRVSGQPGPTEDPSTESYTLGQSPVPPSSLTPPKYGSGSASLAKSERIPATLGGGGGDNGWDDGGRYLVQQWEGGTICDKTGLPRTVEVQFHCNTQSTDRIALIRETSICNYVLLVHTPRLCGEAIFLEGNPQVSDPPAVVDCQPVLRRIPANQVDAVPFSPKNFARVEVGGIEDISRPESETTSPASEGSTAPLFSPEDGEEYVDEVEEPAVVEEVLTLVFDTETGTVVSASQEPAGDLVGGKEGSDDVDAIQGLRELAKIMQQSIEEALRPKEPATGETPAGGAAEDAAINAGVQGIEGLIAAINKGIKREAESQKTDDATAKKTSDGALDGALDAYLRNFEKALESKGVKVQKHIETIEGAVKRNSPEVKRQLQGTFESEEHKKLAALFKKRFEEDEEDESAKPVVPRDELFIVFVITLCSALKPIVKPSNPKVMVDTSPSRLDLAFFFGPESLAILKDYMYDEGNGPRSLGRNLLQDAFDIAFSSNPSKDRTSLLKELGEHFVPWLDGKVGLKAERIVELEEWWGRISKEGAEDVVLRFSPRRWMYSWFGSAYNTDLEVQVAALDAPAAPPAPTPTSPPTSFADFILHQSSKQKLFHGTTAEYGGEIAYRGLSFNMSTRTLNDLSHNTQAIYFTHSPELAVSWGLFKTPPLEWKKHLATLFSTGPTLVAVAVVAAPPEADLEPEKLKAVRLPRNEETDNWIRNNARPGAPFGVPPGDQYHDLTRSYVPGTTLFPDFFEWIDAPFCESDYHRLKSSNLVRVTGAAALPRDELHQVAFFDKGMHYLREYERALSSLSSLHLLKIGAGDALPPLPACNSICTTRKSAGIIVGPGDEEGESRLVRARETA